MQILVLNCGSSSVKFALLDLAASAGDESSLRGVAENLRRGAGARLHFREGDA